MGVEHEHETTTSSTTWISDPAAGGDVQVMLQLAGDGLYIFDPSGRRLHHWRYATIMNAGSDFVLASNSNPDVRLTVRDSSLYQAIAIRAPQLPQPPDRLSREQGERMRDSQWSRGMSWSTFLILVCLFLAVCTVVVLRR